MEVYKTIKTPLDYYVYDRYTNNILKISQEDYTDLNSDNKTKALKRYQKMGFLCDHPLEQIKHPETDRSRHYLENRIQQLILQVTQNCNLRCKYCAYSGNYDNRTHSNLDMSFDIAKKAIDFLSDRVNEIEQVNIGFYGGEPLLRVDFLRDCVEYARNRMPYKHIQFSLTTNGTLLNAENAQFLYENNFNIMISMDGGKSDHDKNRVFANGTGSFDIIVQNVNNLYKLYPDYHENVSFNAVLNENCDYGGVSSFYRNNPTFCSSRVSFNLVESSHHKGELSFPDDFSIAFQYDHFIMLMALIGKCDNKYVSRSLKDAHAKIIDTYWTMRDTLIASDVAHHSGPCIPGSRRLFISVFGKMYPCEKIPEVPLLEIGDIGSGFNFDKVKEIMNIGCLSKEQCSICWALTGCVQCVDKCVCNGEYSASQKLKYCNDSKDEAYLMFRKICMLIEFGYTFRRLI